MGRKIIFLDIDGTLTEPGKNVPPQSAVEAIKKAREKGNLVFLCTGRNYAMMGSFLQFGFDGFVSSAGGYIVSQDNIIFDCPMTKEESDLVMDTLKRYEIYRTVETKHGSYMDEECKEFFWKHAKASGNSEMLRWREAMEKTLNIRPMKEYDGKPVYKVVFMAEKEAAVLAAKEELGDAYHFAIQPMDEDGIINGEMQTSKFDKGKGICRVLEYLGMELADSYGFGDSMNDLEMIQVVGTSVCMENGCQELKEIADYVCPPVGDDGLYKAFEKFGLI